MNNYKLNGRQVCLVEELFNGLEVVSAEIENTSLQIRKGELKSALESLQDVNRNVKRILDCEPRQAPASEPPQRISSGYYPYSSNTEH